MIYKTIENFLENFIDSEINNDLDKSVLKKKIPEIKTYFILLYINSGSSPLYNVLGGFVTKEEGLKSLLKNIYKLHEDGNLTKENKVTETITKSVITDTFLKKFVEESKEALKPLIAIFFSGFFSPDDDNWLISTKKNIIEIDISEYESLLKTAEGKKLPIEGATLCEELIKIREDNTGTLDEAMIPAYLLMAKQHKKNSDIDQELNNYIKIIKFNENNNNRDEEYMVDVFFRVGEIYDFKKNLQNAKDNYIRWINCLEKFYGNDSIIVGSAYRVLAKVLDKIGEFQATLKELYKAEKVFEKHLSIEDDNFISLYSSIIDMELIAENYESLYDFTETVYEKIVASNATRNVKAIDLKIVRGEICKNLGRLDKMEELFFESSKNLKENFGENHFLEGRILSNRGDIASENNDFELAEKLYNEAIKIITETLSPNSVESVRVYANLAEMFEKSSDWESATFYHNKIISGREAETSSEDIYVLNQKEKLCSVQRRNKEFDKPLETLQAILKIKENLFSDNHYELITILKELGLINKDMGRYEESKSYFEKALKIAANIYADNNKKIVFIEEELGFVNEKLKNYNEAVSYFHIVLDKHTEPLEKARIHKVLCRIYLEIENTKEAMEHIKIAIKMIEDEVGTDNLLMLECLNLDAEINFILKDNNGALKKLKKIVEILKNNFGENNHNLAVAYQNIAKILINEGNIDEIGSLLDDALEINIKNFGTSDLVVAENYCNLAMYHYKKNDYKKALLNFEETLKINNSLDKPMEFMTAEMYFALGQLYKEQDDLSKAIIYFKESAKKSEYVGKVEIEDKKINRIIDDIYYYEDRSNFNDCRKTFIEYLAAKIALYGKESVNHGDIYKIISQLYLKSDNSEMANLYASKRLELNRSLNGDFALSLVDNYLEIANIEANFNNLKSVKDNIENVNFIIDKKLSEKTIEIAAIRCEIGVINRSIGEFNLAIKNFEDAVEILKNLGEKNSLISWNAHNELSRCNINLKEYNEALKYLKICKDICDSGNLNNKKYDLFTNKYLGKIYRLLEKHELSKKYYNEALKVSIEINGIDSLITGALYTKVGLIYKNNGDYNTAQKYFSNAKVAYKNSLGEKHNNYKYLLAIISENNLNFQDKQNRNLTIKNKVINFIKGN